MKPQGGWPWVVFEYLIEDRCVVCSTAIAWTLFALSLNPAVQTTLRAELRTCPTDMPTTDQLNALPYLEGVVREVLRLYAPVSSTHRIAMDDAVIPLQKPFKDSRGIMQSSIRYVTTLSKIKNKIEWLSTACQRVTLYPSLFAYSTARRRYGAKTLMSSGAQLSCDPVGYCWLILECG